jgi:hypothetical protein
MMSVSNKSASSPKPKTVRCAIYAASNLDAGGAADLNAVRVQRQAIHSCITSQRSKGWVCLPEKYEDVGQRSGALKRPALRKLMAHAEAGELDCIVTYNFDCVTLSSPDRVRLILHFRHCGVMLTDASPLPRHLNKILGASGLAIRRNLCRRSLGVRVR